MKKKLLIAFLCFSLIPFDFFKDEKPVDDMEWKGELQSREVIPDIPTNIGIFSGGFVLGFGLGIWGVLAGSTITYYFFNADEMPQHFEGQFSQEQQGFRKGYSNRAKRYAFYSVLTGSVLGMLVSMTSK